MNKIYPDIRGLLDRKKEVQKSISKLYPYKDESPVALPLLEAELVIIQLLLKYSSDINNNLIHPIDKPMPLNEVPKTEDDN